MSELDTILEILGPYECEYCGDDCAMHGDVFARVRQVKEQLRALKEQADAAAVVNRQFVALVLDLENRIARLERGGDP